MKKYGYIVIIICIVAVGFLLLQRSTRIKIATREQPPIPVSTDINRAQLCFYRESKTDRGLYDRAILKLNIVGDKVTGEFKNIPAEKDKKVGTFEGTVSAVDPMLMARTADVWWDSMAEGMKVKEQLIFIFGEGNAFPAFGEMTDRGDGVYVYKNIDDLSYADSLTDVACDDIRLSK